MQELIPVALWGWPAVVLVFFLTMRARTAVVATFVGGWLFLPVAGYNIEGLPPYDKVTATSASAFLCCMFFDSARVVRWRPTIWDAPFAGWMLSPFASSLAAGSGVYDGLSALLQQVVSWGIPYCIGRVYFCDRQGLRALAMGLLVGGLLYAPLCLFEIRFSPRLHYLVYGLRQHVFYQTMRGGGWRPMAFMQHGLAVGLFMSSAALAGIWMAWSGSVRRILGMPALLVSFGLLVVAILCKSMLAGALLGAGLAVLFLVPAMRAPIAALLLAAGPPVYAAARLGGAWDPAGITALVASVSDRAAESIDTRFRSEEALMAHAMARPLFGYSRSGAVPRDEKGRRIGVPDGLWIITLSRNGLVGLATLMGMMLLPAVRSAVRLRPHLWNTPEAAPAAFLSVALSLFMIDSLFNAMFNPLFVLACGGLTGWMLIGDPVLRRHAPTSAELRADLRVAGSGGR